MTREEILSQLHAGECVVEFTKVNGEHRAMRCTLSESLMPPAPVHCVHKPSGAHGYSEASRSQLDNKREAFRKMAETPEFKKWHQLEVNRRTGIEAEIDRYVEQELKKVRVEIKEHGKWTEWRE